ncbi:hypothetical protein SASPL_155531 (mitochondrion) [Salvia splendens]|uniref:Uncharacterized protein n=1 Tax=Salvia splendens TaxID=180675 RepID=A0A8X8VWX1_SALSN|nr:hypothetical protein SASPL_156338 [Salvia splendens]KAG6384677.1 hypothetical protein SASPL_155531 [Salvia splendens]
MAFLSAAGTRGTTGHSIQSKQVMRRGPVQDRTVPLQRQQTLSTARRHSLSELFQLLYDFSGQPSQESSPEKARIVEYKIPHVAVRKEAKGGCKAASIPQQNDSFHEPAAIAISSAAISSPGSDGTSRFTSFGVK